MSTITMMGWGVGGAILLTLLLSLLLPFAVKPLLMKLGIMDIPNARSSHERPVLRGLGLAVLIAMAVGGAVAVWGLMASGDSGSVSIVTAATTGEDIWSSTDFSVQYMLIVVLGSLAAGLLGLSEDLRGLSVPARSVFLLGIAVAVVVALLWVARASFGGASFGWGMTATIAGMPAWGLILLGIYGVLFISSYINVANFMDGLNGISGFHGVIAGLAFAFAGDATGQVWLVAAGFILAAGFLGFLPWNLTKPGAFLGDVGSYLLGGAVAVTSLAAFVSGVPLLAPIGPMVIYFGDVGVTLVKRVRAGKRWDEPHKEHTYQRIQQLGYTHVQASAITTGCTALASALGLLSLYTHLLGTLALFAGGLAVVVIYLMLPRLLPSRVTA